jgi:toxin ParE1/3/4
MRQVVFRQQARRELDQASDWYEKERVGLGVEFLAEIQILIDRITSNPEQFPILHRDVRKAVAREKHRSQEPLLSVAGMRAPARNCPV